jgi:hypothetical protein
MEKLMLSQVATDHQPAIGIWARPGKFLAAV